MKRFLLTATISLIGLCGSLLMYYRKKKKEDFINSLNEINMNVRNDHVLSDSTVLLHDMIDMHDIDHQKFF